MGQVLVRNLHSQVVRKLKLRARQHRRSLQEEAKDTESTQPGRTRQTRGLR